MVPLAEGVSLVVGRARPADIPIRDPSLSRQHARFTLVDNELWVEDLGSTNGTFLNGKKIRRSRVKKTDEIRLGSVVAALHALASSGTTLQGLESHDNIIQKLEQEVARAQAFGRSVAVLMVRTAARKHGHLSRWGLRVAHLLRPVDSIALYDPSSVLIVLAESGRKEALALAELIIKGETKGDPPLLCGIAVYPQNAISVDRLIDAVRQSCRQATSRQRVVQPAEEIAYEPAEEKVVLIDPQMREIFNMAMRVADAASPVLIYGETGTGKEVVARAIHDSGCRRSKPLRCINCAALPEQLLESALFGHERGAFTGANQQAKGLFEEANGGTVLLDEIGELSPSAQAKLLRVIETQWVSRVGSSKEFQVDVRILAATHRDVEQMCENGEFRWDLFYRLNTILLKIPPLRQRQEEILPLAEHFMKGASRANHCRVRTIDPESRKLLQNYNWPGNVRELRNVIDRAVLIAQDETITVDDLSERIRRSQPATDAHRNKDNGFSIKDKLKQFEADLLVEALRAHDWNQTKTASALGMPLRTLVHKMNVFGLKKGP